mgnify:CR=1 FL=1
MFEKFHAVYLPIPEQKKAITLKDCFEEFNREEMMDGENQMPCERCQEPRDTKKEMSVYEVNTVFILCLKRFLDGRKD